MKKFMAIAVIMAVVLYAMPALAGTCGCSSCTTSCVQTCPKPVKTCAPCARRSFFQSASDSLTCFHPKPWLVRPMKPVGPIKKEQVDQFQRLADSIERCPAKCAQPAACKTTTCCCPRCAARK